MTFEKTFYIYSLDGELVLSTTDESHVELFFDMHDIDFFTVQTSVNVLTDEEREEWEAYEHRERMERFRYEDGDHHEERAERLPEHDYPN